MFQRWKAKTPSWRKRAAAGPWAIRTSALALKVEGNTLSGYLDGALVVKAQDAENRFPGGGIALVCEEGRIGCEDVEVRPI